jgi:hypothetical protein
MKAPMHAYINRSCQHFFVQYSFVLAQDAIVGVAPFVLLDNKPLLGQIYFGKY